MSAIFDNPYLADYLERKAHKAQLASVREKRPTMDENDVERFVAHVTGRTHAAITWRDDTKPGQLFAVVAIAEADGGVNFAVMSAEEQKVPKDVLDGTIGGSLVTEPA